MVRFVTKPISITVRFLTHYLYLHIQTKLYNIIYEPKTAIYMHFY